MNERPVVLAPLHVRSVLASRARGDAQATMSLDLGISTVAVALTDDGVRLPDTTTLTWAVLEHVAEDEASHTEGHCFVFSDGAAERIQVFSEQFNRLYSLVATRTAPTMLISGIPMHRIKDADPISDTAAKIRALRPLQGATVLDTATGLGYTATAATRQALSVTTCELDPKVLEICRLNPWSAGLFDNPRIKQRVGDSYELVRELADGQFTRIVHDPPMFNLAGELYSTEFYVQLRRVLTRSGRLYHYIGNPDSPSGRSVTRGVIRRLQDAGFRRVQPRPEAFGVLALP